MPADAKTGTLRFLVCCPVATPASDYALMDAVPLAWVGEPAFASLSVELDDCDLGDYDCAPLPELERGARGLWLLTWPWQEVPHPDDDEETTARYADVGEWSRPTIADLAELGVLPATTEATS